MSEADVIAAWGNALSMRHRNFDPPAHIMAAGVDTRGRLIEMLGVELENDDILVYHAMRLTAKAAHELGL